MKRKRDGTPLDQPIERNLWELAKGVFRGESTNKDNYTLDQKTKSLANIIKEEKQAVQDHVDAINKVKQAHKEEEIAKLKL